jgi:hypothetical protein
LYSLSRAPARAQRAFACCLVFGLALGLTACADMAPAPARAHRARVASAPPPPPPPPVSTRVYVYPTAGQSSEQQSRDRYECYLWSVKQTGFDPSQTQLAPHQRVEVVPMPAAGHDTAVGAVTGAVLGAVIARPGDAAAAAVGGAIVGGAMGAASDASRQARAQQVQQRYDRRAAAQSARLEEQASNYRRALTACLEGRGYTVK